MPKFEKISREEKKPIRIGVILMLVAAVLVVLVVKIDVVSEVVAAALAAFSPFLYGIALAYFLNVFVLMFEGFLFRPIDKRVHAAFWLKIRRPLAIGLSLILLIFILLFAMLFMIPELISSITNLAVNAQKSVPVYMADLMNWLEKFQADNNLRFDFDKLLGQFNWESLISNATQITTDFLSTVFDATKNVVSGVSTAVVAFIFSLYLLFGKEKLLKSTRSFLFAYFPEKAAKKVNAVSSIANDVFYSFIRGQLLEAVILGGLCYLGMLVIGFDYALLIAAIMALSALVPIMGAYIGAVIGAFILLITNPIDALWFLVFIIILQQLEGNLIYPRVVGSSIGLPAIWTMFAVLFCGTLFGIPGVLLGTPIAAVLYRLLRTATKTRLREREVDPRQLEVAPRSSSTKSAVSSRSRKKTDNHDGE